jgi:3D (Asp-Asp-Asp) domain-containing protein
LSVCLFILLWHGTATKKVYVVINGKEQAVTTKQWTVRQVLDELAVKVGEHDRLWPAPDAKLKHGDKIVLDTAIPVRLTADGKTETKYTIGRTVSAALDDLNVELGSYDKVTPSLDEPISENTDIQVVRVSKVIENEVEPIPFKVITKNDPNLLKGKEKVLTEGREGVLAKTVEKVYEDGVLVAENVIDTEVQQESVNRVVALGTKNPVVTLSASSPDIDAITRGGVTFAYKQILNNVTLTAYTASSSGKPADSPGYGVTATGTRVTEGRTIAVDPKVIPLGWWVYIEGIGFRRAEDTGSGIKGNKIDIYFDSLDYAKRFGIKRGYKVYIIGTEKPAAN